MTDCLVKFPRRVGASMHNWHSGMGDPIYAVGSQIYAGRAVAASDVSDAISNIRRAARSVRSRKDKHAARALVATLENRVRAQCPGALDGVRRKGKRR